MESKIIQQEKNPFLHREEFVIEFKSESNPSFDDVKKALGKDDDELVVVKKIKSNFGKKIFAAEAVVYDSKEAKEKIEISPKKTKKKPVPSSEGSPGGEESPVWEEKTEESKKPVEGEQPAEEAPVEEVKEDKTETKPEENK